MPDLLQEFCKIHKDILHALLHTLIVAMETNSSTHLLSLNLVYTKIIMVCVHAAHHGPWAI